MSTPVSIRPDNTSVPPGVWSEHFGKKKQQERWTAARLSRRVPYLLLGIILVVACAAAAMVVSAQLDNRQPVLMLARSVSVGQPLSVKDRRQVAVSTDVGLDAVPATDSSTVLGQPVAYSLPAGTVLTRAVVGVPAIPFAGQAVTAVGLAAGQFPPALAPGTRVAVVVSAAVGVPGGSASEVAEPIAQWTATVVDVSTRVDQQTTVVALQLAEPDARRLAAAPDGQISLVTLSGGGR